MNNLTQAIGIGVGDDHGLAIVGTVSSPIVTVTPPSLDFGGQLKTTTSLTRSVTISNTGNASLTVNSASLGGTNAGDFAIVGPTLPFTVAPGSSKVISLTFAPPVSGYRVASLQINDTGADSPHIVPLSGYGQDTAPISGSVVNWGNNSQGQLGTGNYIGSPTPVMPTGLPGPVIAVAGGHDYSLALLTDGSVWAWGANGTGQLGNGSSSQSNLPVQVNISGVIAIAAGFWHAVALKSDGTVWAWGWNNFGQLGNNYDVTSNLPVQVLNSDYTIFSGVKAIAAGGSNSLALKQDGTLWAWGSNGSGQLGIGSTTPIPYSPNQVNISGSIQNFKVGDSFVLATKTDGSVWVWGKNDQGQLGLGTTANVNTPTQNSSLSGITDIGVGSIFGFALKNDGTVYSWGHNNRAELGRGNNTDSLVPVAVSGLRGATLVEGGDEFGLALKSDGTVWGWGYNNDGELGNGGQNNPNYNPGCACQVSPARSGSISQLLGLGAGDAHGMAIVGPINRPIFSSDSSLDFGNQVVGQTSLTSSITISNSGQVAFSISSLSLGGANSGNFSLVGATLPINVAGNSSVSLNLTFNPNVVGIRTATLTITSTAVDSPYILPLSGYGILTPPPLGSLRAWGENGFGELGTGNLTNTNVITNVVGLGNVVAIASGDNHNLALLVDGTVWAWGYNGYGQLGNGTNTNSNIPLKVPGLRGVTAIAASSNQSFALRSDGTLWGWGSNGNGALGLGHNINRNVPTQVLNNDYSVFGGVKQVVAGGDHTFAQKQDGSWWVWGTNSAGQLGIGSTVSPYYFPTPFNSLPGVSQLSAGYSHTLALKNDGTVYVWGDNTYGQLGLGNTQAISVPVKINNNTYTAIGTGTYHSLATRSDATVWTWGYNSNGQLGNNSIAQSNIPVQVSGISGATGLAGSGLHSLAAVGGLVYAWGYNGYGQLGDGTNTQRLTPVQVINLTSVGAVEALSNSSLALVTESLARVGFSPASTQFVNQSVGATSPPKQVNITNNGSANLILTTVTLSGPNAADFNLTVTGLPVTLNPGASLPVTLTFTASATGQRRANLVVTDNAPDSPQTYPVLGFVDPSALNGNWAGAQTLTLTSGPNGTQKATVDQYISTGNSSKWFKITAGLNAGVVISLTNASGAPSLPADYDLAVYKDLQVAYNQLILPQDLVTVASQAAPYEFLPYEFLPYEFLPYEFLPYEFLPYEFLPYEFLPYEFLSSNRSAEAHLPYNMVTEPVLPNSYQSEQYNSALRKGILSLSIHDGLSPESIKFNTFTNTGDIYIRVRSAGGATSIADAFHLDITVTGGA